MIEGVLWHNLSNHLCWVEKHILNHIIYMKKGNIKHHIRSLTLLLSTNWESHKETPLKGISWLPGLAEMISAAFI